ncbi:MAG TPA: hypothetical protein VG076_12685 [Acidimicrobiales bacterium]|jgi:hypothetical protein|nr:hypothetical protein [Acidimicrobiales bacterium]
MRRFSALVAVVASVGALGSGLVGCSSRALGPGEARLTVASGRAQVAATGENWHNAHSDQRLRRNDRVRVLQGLTEVHFSSERTVELRSGGELQVLPQPALMKGDVLATAKATPLTVTAGNADARVRDGAAHVSRALGVTAASYAGDLTVTSAGRDLTVPALRQAGIPGPGLVPPTPSPLDYRADNPWDRRYLGDAIDLGDELQARSQGFTAQLAPGEGHTAGFYRQLLPALESQPAFTQALLAPDMAPGETLVGAAITVQGHNGNFLDRWQAVFAFHDQGARWGLVALDQHVTRGPLLGEVDDALGRRSVGTTAAAAPVGGATSAPALLPSPSAAPAANAPATGGAGNAPTNGGGSSGGGGKGGAPPSTTPPPGQGLLPPLLPNPSPSPTTTVPPSNPVGGLLQGVGNVVGGLLGGLLGGGR